MEKHSVSNLIGSPPGYVRHEEAAVNLAHQTFALFGVAVR